MPDPEVIATPVQDKVTTKPAELSKKAASKRHKKKKKKGKRKAGTSQRTRTVRPYPASSFEEALPLAEAIHEYASSEKVRRLTLLKHLEKSPTSSSTMMLITNSTKYGLTKGSYAADWLELTEIGSIASNPASPPREKLKARFDLAIEGVAPFQKLYSEFKGKRLPSHDVLKDVLLEGKFEIDKPTECVDLFIVNAKYLGLLQTIAGSETLIPIEQALDELGNGQQVVAASTRASAGLESVMQVDGKAVPSKVDWSKTCFVITPIGDEGTETRKHADLFLSALIEPALREFGLDVIRADKIGGAGMITSQILEHVMRCRLAIVDLSHHNPNAFYEMAIRHACRLPVIQIIRKQDKLPFDVNQVRTVVIDTTDIYTLVPKLETYRSEIATQVRAVLDDGSVASNPISVFFPGFKITVPAEK
jgi:hypothetical protein